jgi:hypothetical protein
MSSPPRLPVLPILPVAPRRRTWRDEAREAVTDLAGLERALRLTDDEREGARRSIASGFPMSITPYYLSLCDPDDAACPIRLQCVPRAQEAVEVKGDLRDPLGEEAHEVAPNLVQRYPDHPRAPDALLTVGNAQVDLGDRKAAADTFRAVTEKFDGSGAAQTARERLVTLAGPAPKR